MFYTANIAKLNAPSELDLYAVLGVSQHASGDEIRRHFKRLAKMFHPDLNQDPAATERMKHLNQAYAILGDAARRTIYDSLIGADRWGLEEDERAPQGAMDLRRYEGDLDTEISVEETLSRRQAAQELLVRKSDFRIYYVSSLDRQTWYRVSSESGCHCPDAAGLAGPFGCKHWYAMEAFRNNGDSPIRCGAQKGAKTARQRS